MLQARGNIISLGNFQKLNLCSEPKWCPPSHSCHHKHSDRITPPLKLVKIMAPDVQGQPARPAVSKKLVQILS